MAALLAKLPRRRMLTRPRWKRDCLYHGNEGRGREDAGLDSPVPIALGKGGAESIGAVGVAVERGRRVLWGCRGRIEWRAGRRGLVRRQSVGSIVSRLSTDDDAEDQF